MKKLLEVLLYNDLEIDRERGNSDYSKKSKELLHDIIEKRKRLENELNDKQKSLLEELKPVLHHAQNQPSSGRQLRSFRQSYRRDGCSE